MYHVDLGLSDDQVLLLKQTALSAHLSVKDLVTQIVVKAITPESAPKKHKVAATK